MICTLNISVDYLKNSSVTSDRIAMKELPGRKAILIGKKVFGEFNYREFFCGPEKEQVQVVLPKILNDIMDYVHSFPSLTEPRENIVAFLSGVLSYKASVGVNWINVYKKNYFFLENLKQFFEVVGCDAKIFKGTTQCKLRISKTSFLNLLSMIETLPEDLQLLNHQKKLIEARFERSRAKPFSFSRRAEEILKSLREKPKTMWEIIGDVGIAYSSLRRYIRKLMDEKLIKVVGRRKVKKTCATVYGLAEL